MPTDNPVAMIATPSWNWSGVAIALSEKSMLQNPIKTNKKYYFWKNSIFEENVGDFLRFSQIWRDICKKKSLG